MDGEDPFDHFDEDDLQPDNKPSAKKKAGRTKSGDNVRVIEMRKERSRNAARNRRGKENAQFDELAKLLPLPAAITSQLDKASIIRLTISYLNMREFSGAVPKMQLQLTDGSDINLSPSEERSDVSSSPQPSTSREVVHYDRPSTSSVIPDLLSETGSQLLQALEGFLMVLSIEGKILYVSETVSVNLGLSQVELTGNSVFNYIHQEDHPDVLEQLTSSSTEDPAEDSQFQGLQGFFSCQGQRTDSLFNQGEEIGPPKILPHQPRSFFVRMKCTLVRRGGSYAKSAGFKVVHCVGRVKEYASDKNEAPRRAFVLLAQPVPTMNINELPLECNMFVSRVNMDLKIVYCEGRIHRFMDYLAKDIVGISAYDFYHAGDVALIQGHHAKFLSKGQVWTKYYRWMNKNGGWVWMQTKASLIPHPSNPALKQMLCLNYILSDVEHRSVVLGMAQLDNKPELTSAPPNILTEVPCDGDSTGELNDALIDDQVMVFPKWQATSDKLVPQQTLLDQMVLQRTGYTQQFNEAFNNWSSEHQSIDRKTSQSDESHDQDFDDKELQDIADIINADVTPFDQSLFDFVVSGTTPSLTNVPSSHLGPIGGYIEEIPTTYASTTSVVPKEEKNSVSNDYSSTMSCSQGRKRPAPATSFSYDGNSVDSSVASKAPRLSHMQEGTTPKTTPQYQDNTWKVPSSTSTTYPASGRYTGANQLAQTATSTTTNQSMNITQGGAHNMGPNAGPGLNTFQIKTTIFANRKPKSLLEQLVMMPGSGKEDDLMDDDLMLELVEELMERGADVDMMDNVSSVQDSTVGSSSRNNTFVPFQNIKQEVVTPTATNAPSPFSECIQNIPKPPMNHQQFKGLYQSSTSDGLQSERRSQQRNINMQDGGSVTSLRSTTQQQQWVQPERVQNAWQQQQQQGSMPQQYQIPNNQIKQTSSQQQQQRQQQQSRTSYSFTGPPQQQRQLQQQRTPELQSIAEQSQIFRELNELIKQNNSMQQNTQNIASQRVLISSAPLPELSNVIDEELNSLPLDNQINSLNTQNFNGTVPGTGNRNFTGMM